MMGADQRELQVRSRINRPEQGVAGPGICISEPRASASGVHGAATPLADACGSDKAGVSCDACERHNAVVQ